MPRNVSVLKFPPYEFLKPCRDPPHRKRVLVRRIFKNKHGVEIEVTISSNWPRNKWWAVSSFVDGFRHSNGLSTGVESKAQEWIAAVESGRVDVDR